MRWKKEFETGIPIIDSQHKELFSILSFPNMALQSELYKLIRILREHHKTEELLMELYGYTEIEIHKQQHEAQLEILERIIKTGEDIPIRELLERHISEDKLGYVGHFKKLSATKK